MDLAPSPEAFVSDWFGRYYVGRSFVVWSKSSTLAGVVMWGRPEVEDVAELEPLFAVKVRTDDPAFDVVTDCSRLQSVSAGAFGAFFPLTQRALALHGGRLRKHALIAPSALWGAFVAGAMPIMIGGHAFRICADASSAYAWIERDEAVEAREEVDALMARLLDVPMALRNVRGYLSEHVEDASLEKAARALGVSRRSLQRELAAGGTTFRRELDSARFRVAIDLVNLSEMKLEAIAREVGLSSLAKLNDVFRRAAGVTPKQLRQRRSS